MKIGPNCQPKINYGTDSWAMKNICTFLIFGGTLSITVPMLPKHIKEHVSCGVDAYEAEHFLQVR